MTDSSQRMIIERIEPRTWNLRLRDNKTDQVHEIELRGHGPWSVELNGKAEVTSAGDARTKAQVAPPPDDAITLRFGRSAGSVRVGAVGRGAKAWAGQQATLLGSRWFLDDMGAPIVLLDDRPTLVDEIRAALPQVTLDLSGYGAGQAEAKETAGREDPTRATDEATVPSSAVRGFKKGGRGFAGKIERAADSDVRLGLSNIGRSDDQVSITATVREGQSVATLRAWTEQRAASLGPWQPLGDGFVALIRERPTLPEELAELFPGIRLDVGMYQRPGAKDPTPDLPVASEDPGAVRILDDIIRRLSEVFVVEPLGQGFESRSVELRTDRTTGIYDGLPVGTALVRITLRPAAEPTIRTKDWEPLRKTLKELGRPAAQLGVLREYVSETVKKAVAAARAGSEQLPSPASSAAAPPATTSKPRGRKKAEPAAGPGPGDLVWTPIVDKGTEGLAARWGEGQFKLLHVGAERYGLFYEHDGGGYETLLCGSLDDGKAAAGERVSGSRPALDLKAAQVACATTRRTEPPTHDEITLHLREVEGPRPDVVIRATGDRVHQWVFLHSSVLGHAWERGEENFPIAIMSDKPTLVANLRKEFPGVNIDLSEYEVSRRTEPQAAATETAQTVEPPESSGPPAALPPTPPPPSAPPSPEPEDAASQDAEFLRLIKDQLADMLDEED